MKRNFKIFIKDGNRQKTVKIEIPQTTCKEMDLNEINMSDKIAHYALYTSCSISKNDFFNIDSISEITKK